MEVIIATGCGNMQSAVQALRFGAFDYISKPINTSELKTRLARAINKHSEIAEKNRKIVEMERLYYTIAHDFKSTILSIKSFSDLLSRDYFDKVQDREGRFLLERINANVSAMEGITERLLEYSRIGKFEEEWIDIDTEALMGELLDNYDLQIKEREIELQVESPLPRVHFYMSGLRSVFTNLIDNAVKYTREDVKSYVRIGTEPSPGAKAKHHHFFVADNGVGIKPENIERIFEIFQREDAEGRGQGYGIGLALVKKILEMAGCSISVESREGEETIFRFTLPVP